MKRRLTIISIGRRRLVAAIAEGSKGACKIKRIFTQPLADGGAESLAAALAKVPQGFRRHRCHVILPKIHPLHKCIIHHPVAPDLRRIMLADAIEMDLPIKSDAFAWDFFPLHVYDTGERFLSYVFAERWSQVKPIFDAFLRAKIYPRGALVPLAIEFSSAMAADAGNFLQLCIDEEAISLVFTGGERPYARCLPHGWTRVLGNGDAEAQWDDWIKNDCSGNGDLAEKMDEFFHELAAEIHTCELYYFHRLQGRPHTQMAVVSSRPGSRSWIRFLKKHLTHPTNVIVVNESWKCPISAPGEVPDEITRMHLFHGAEMLFNGTMDNPSVVVPPAVAQKERQARCFLAKVTACAVACGVLLLGNLYHVTQNYALRQNLASLRQKTDEERVTAVSIGRLNGEMEGYRAQLERANEVHSCQAAWTALFQELQDILVAGGNGWLDELRVMSSSGDAPREVAIGGCIFADEGEEILPKFRRFFEQLETLPVVGSTGNLTLAEARPGAQPFQCTITLNAKYFKP
ncbi:MAG: hypothetical protein LBF26_00300 [Puniceicoccales bacterium]|jgi:hypothetical protein|nr:hypothetical protein [Puniceicoccales bacterium]